jgi:hypothetical protein
MLRRDSSMMMLGGARLRDLSMGDIESGLQTPPKGKHGFFEPFWSITGLASASRVGKTKATFVVVLLGFVLLVCLGLLRPRTWPSQQLKAIEGGDSQPPPYIELQNLVMVAGHAVYTSTDYSNAGSEVRRCFRVLSGTDLECNGDLGLTSSL